MGFLVGVPASCTRVGSDSSSGASLGASGFRGSTAPTAAQSADRGALVRRVRSAQGEMPVSRDEPAPEHEAGFRAQRFYAVSGEFAADLRENALTRGEPNFELE